MSKTKFERTKPHVIPDELAMKAGMLIERPDQRKNKLAAGIQLAMLRDIAASRTPPKEP